MKNLKQKDMKNLKQKDMKNLRQYQSDFQQTLSILEEMNEANRGNYEVYYDANLFECDEVEVENGEFVYTSRDYDVINEMHIVNTDRFFTELQNLGYEVYQPYNDSIYLTKDGKVAISMRNHNTASSTMRHWDRVISVDINNGDISRYIDMI